jgi:hypothetical protein
VITVLYSCDLCGLVDAPVQLPYRESSEDVVEWVHKVGAICAQDHMRRSPERKPETLQNIKIPMPAGTEWVGGPVQQ